jgi:tetratricopeptide (TPR) repeat protein
MRATLYFLKRFMLVGLLLAGNLYAIGSEEKTPEEKASADAKKSVAAYNEAVKRIDHAGKIGGASDSTYGYNYRIHPEEKAKREYEKAVKDLQKAIELNPNFKEAHNNLGYCYRKLGKLNESLTAYDKAISLDSNFAQAREYRGETYLALGRVSDAESELKFLLEAKSEYADQLSRSIELYKFIESGKTANPSSK